MRRADTERRPPIREPSGLASRAAVAAAVALLAPLLWPLASGRVFRGDDLGHFHLPLRHFYARALASGDDPRWHPGLFCGVYVHGEGQAGMAHPLHALIYLGLPLATAFQVEVAIGYPIAFAGMALWLRRLGLGRAASAYGALGFAGSTFFTLRYVHMNALEVLAHLPWLLLGIEALARPRDAREAAWAGFGVAMLTASQGLLGYPQYMGISTLAEGLYAVARFGRSPSPWLGCAGAKGLGWLAAAVQLLPHAEALGGSRRAGPTIAFLGINSLHPLNLLQVLGPTLFRRGHYSGDGVAAWPWHESVAYLGAVVPASCAWLWVRRRDLGRWRPLASWAAGLAGLALILALGRFTPLFPIYASLPGARLFRGPSRYVAVVQLAATVLAAIAFADLSGLIARGERLSRRALRPLAAPAVASLAAGVALVAVATLCPRALRASQVGSFGDVLVGAALMAIPSAAMAMGARGWRLAPVTLVAIAAADSAAFGVGPVLSHERPVDPLSPEALGPAPPPGAWGRVASSWNESSANGASLVEGYVALRPRRLLDYSKPEALRLAGVAWMRDGSGRGWRAAALPPMPRARLVSRAVPSADPRADLAAIDPRTTALVEPSPPLSLPGGATGTSIVTTDRPGRIAIETRSEAARLLVVSEAHHQGWHARIDGRDASVLRADGDFLACVVPPGRHLVSFRFDPESDRIGRRLSGLGLALIAVVLVARLVAEARSGAARDRGGRTRGGGARKSLTLPRGCDQMAGPPRAASGWDRGGST